MSKLQDRYGKLSDQLKNPEKQKRQAEADVIVKAYRKSGKSLNEVMTFRQLMNGMAELLHDINDILEKCLQVSVSSVIVNIR